MKDVFSPAAQDLRPCGAKQRACPQILMLSGESQSPSLPDFVAQSLIFVA